MSDEATPRTYPAHVPDRCKAGLDVANAGKPLAAFGGDPAQLLERLRGGETVPQIAAELGVSHVSMYGFLLRNAPEQWQEISAGRALSRLDKAETDLDTAEDQLTVSRARESAKLAQWNLERANRKLYGDSKPDNSGLTIQVLIARDGETQTRVIDGEAA